jgi:hypothetical protein
MSTQNTVPQIGMLTTVRNRRGLIELLGNKLK